MKKVCAVAIAVVVIQLLSVFAFANSSFVSSPSGVSAPKVTQISKETESCTAVFKVCAYGERSELEDKLFAAMMTDAYEKIANSEDLGELGEDVEKLAASLNIDSDVFVASELFALFVNGCDVHGEHGAVKLAVEPTVVENFAGLIKYNGVEWEVVECKLDKGAIVFDFEEDAAYSILLHDGTATSGNALVTTISLIAGAVVVVVIALLIVCIKKKFGKDTTEDATE